MIPFRRENVERCKIYKRLRELGLNRADCVRLRDWSVNKIDLWLKTKNKASLGFEVRGIYEGCVSNG